MPVLSKTIPKILAELAAIAVLIVSVVWPYFGAISQHQSLSKLSLLCDIDLAQDANRSFAVHDDPSQATTHVPNERLIEGSSELPLWNPNNGAGRPVVGDFQTLIFSFIHKIFPSQDAQLATIAILFKIMVAACGTYFLSRTMGLKRIASLAAGQAFALAPHSVAFAELCGNYCFYPWLTLVSLWCFSRPAAYRVVLLGLCFGVSAYNMHPESFVCGVAAAVFLAAVHTAFVLGGSTDRKREIGKLLAAVCGSCALAFFVAAPLLLPFCEFLANGSSYKFVDTHAEFPTLFTFTSNLIAPFSSGGNFLGLALALCLPLGILCSWRKYRAVLITFILALLFTTRPGPLEGLFGQKPISYLLPEYTLYSVILLAAVTAAIGLDAMQEFVAERRWQKLKSLLLPAAALLFAVLLNNAALCERWSDITNFGYDGNFSIFTTSALMIDAFILVALICLAAANNNQLQRFGGPLALSLVLANYLQLAACAKSELPAKSAFWYKPSEILSLLQKHQNNYGFRATAAGEHILQPNTNLIFGFDDYRCTAPLHPRRYADFSLASGIKARNCNIYTSPYDLSSLYDLASVKWIVSNSPIHSSDPKQKQIEMGTAENCDYSGGPVKLRPGLRLDGASINYYPKSHEITGSASFAVHMSGRFTYYYQWILLDGSDKSLWQSTWQASTIDQVGSAESNHQYKVEFSAPVPIAKNPDLIKVVLRIRSGSSVDSPNWHDRSLLLASVKPHESGEKEQGRIERIGETTNGFQLYENRSALPSVYMVHNAKLVANSKDALSAVQDKQTDWKSAAVVEVQDRVQKPQEEELHLPAQPDTVRLLDKDSNNVSVLAQSKAPGYLILTDTFYPGWSVYVDGKIDTIYAANHAFRAVYLPAGKHYVLFNYNPRSYTIGLQMLMFALGFSLLIIIAEAVRFQIKRAKSLTKTTENSAEISAADIESFSATKAKY